MDNSGIVNRLKGIMLKRNLSSSVLADEIDVQRSSVSHILTGRNKPSLDFVLKLVKRYPEIDIYWLLNGGDSDSSKKEKEVTKVEDNIVSTEVPITPITNLIQNKEQLDVGIDVMELNKNTNKQVSHIVIFYEDGTFKNYSPG